MNTTFPPPPAATTHLAHGGAAMVRGALAAAAAAVLAGCASLSADGGFDKVGALAKERTGQSVAMQRSPSEVESARARVAELLQAPLTADTAVEVALLNNKGLQARLAQVGIAEADLVRAGRLRNPSFTFGRLQGGGDVEIDRAILFDILGLFTMPLAMQLEQQRFEQAQYQAADDAVALASATRRAWFEAVASRELVAYFEQVKEAADASSELARRMAEAGNSPKLTQMREQAFQADAAAQLARARHQATLDAERLTRCLGLSSATGLRLPDRLPPLPAQAVEPKDAEQKAIDTRLDVQMARRSTEAMARSLGLTKATRFINVLEAGFQSKSESGRPGSDGYQIALELPLFDFGAARTARAEATYMQAVHRTAEIATNARSEVRESYSAYRTAYALARQYRDEVVPLRKRISEENLLRYNGMLISVFELLADAREQVAGVTGYVQALRDFWLADTNLQTALAGHSPEPAPASRPLPAAGTAPTSH